MGRIWRVLFHWLLVSAPFILALAVLVGCGAEQGEVATPAVSFTLATVFTPNRQTTPLATPTTVSKPTATAMVLPTSAAKAEATPDLDLSLLSLSFADDRNGWALGNHCSGAILCTPQLLLHTDDSGYSWQQQAAPPAVFGIRFSNAKDGLAFGDGLYATHDGGASWTETLSDTKIINLSITSGLSWMIADDCVPQEMASDKCVHILFVSKDQGSTWRRTAQQPELNTLSAPRIAPIGSQALYNLYVDPAPSVGTSYHLQKTVNAGATWQDVLIPKCEADTWASLDGLAPDNIWLLCGGVPGTSMQGKFLYHSTDAGAHWDLINQTGDAASSMPSIGSAVYIQTTGPQDLWLHLDRYTTYRSLDGGLTWNPALPQLVDMGDLFVEFTDSQHGWAGVGRQLYHTTDSGQSWAQVNWP